MRLPMSPYETRQELYRDDPFKFLMVCFMLNQTSHKQVDQVREAFFEKYPNAETLEAAEESEIASLVKILGFYNKRAKSWKKFASEWIALVDRYDGCIPPIYEIEKLHGVGKYALDSWKVFQLFEYDTDVDDHVLNWYVSWAKEESEKIKRESSEWKPRTVYYLHMEDDRGAINNWNVCRDYACVVMARTINEAIEKTQAIALDQYGAKHIKILGIGYAKEEWVNEESPMKSDPEYYKTRSKAVLESVKGKNLENYFSNKLL
jgi:endonuclease III